MKAVAAIVLMTVVVCIVGCTKPDGPNNGGTMETEETITVEAIMAVETEVV